MKKILIFLTAALFAAGCTATPKADVKDTKEETKQVAQTSQKAPQQAQEKANKQECEINGHDCWAVVQKLGTTKEIRTENPDKNNLWAPDIITYENKDLQNWGLKVTFYTMYRDGGSTLYVLNENIAIRTNRSIGMQGTPAYGQTTVKFKETSKQFIYDSTGKLTESGTFSLK